MKRRHFLQLIPGLALLAGCKPKVDPDAPFPLVDLAPEPDNSIEATYTIQDVCELANDALRNIGPYRNPVTGDGGPAWNFRAELRECYNDLLRAETKVRVYCADPRDPRQEFPDPRIFSLADVREANALKDARTWVSWMKYHLYCMTYDPRKAPPRIIGGADIPRAYVYTTE